ncbi:MAG: hypothetical protein JST00_16895 [Deltaproteobacteria bacterium]|nr:hypothetical protein [Deltaproteobacteria bacterium]
MSIRAALDRLTQSLEGPGLTCIVVDAEHPEPGARLAVAAARESSGKRAFYRDVDPELAAIVQAGSVDRPPAWIACEPVLDEDGSRIASLVLIAADEGGMDALARLPRLASECAPFVASARFARKAGDLVHALNNQLATTIVNVELALEILVNPRGSDDHSELLKSLGFARRASKRMRSQLEELGRFTPKARAATNPE